MERYHIVCGSDTVAFIRFVREATEQGDGLSNGVLGHPEGGFGRR